MKNKKIVFCGFAATLLMAGTANAAVKIASQEYVDRVDNVIAESVDSVQTQVTELDTVVNDPDTGLVSGVADLQSQISGKQDVANLTQTINDESQETQYPSAAAVNTAIKDATTGLVVSEDLEDLAGDVNALNTNVIQLQFDVKSKQDSLNDNQMNAVNSGITADKVTQYDEYATQIAAKPDAASLATVATTGSYNDLKDAPAPIVVDATLSAESTNPVQNKVINAALADKASTQDVSDIAEDVTILEYLVNNEDTGLSAQVADIVTAVETAQSGVDSLTQTVGNAEGGLVKDVTDLQGDMSGKQDVAGRENTITDDDTKYPSSGAVYDALATKADVDTTYTKEETDNQITTLAIPRPSDECMASSGLCVLSVTSSGDFAWVNVAYPD